MSQTPFQELLNELSPHPLHVLDPSIPRHSYLKIDLSIDNKELSHIDVSSSKKLGQYILNKIKSNDASVGYGGYLERRAIYERSSYFSDSSSQKIRNIHLGMDLWIKEDSNIYNPLDAIVHSIKNNTNHGDYGPTIILEHTYDKETFYSLYGHLSLNSINNIKEGQPIKKGDVFAQLGNSNVNGDYPPHLHFQLIRNLQDNHGDYPGVASSKDIDFYKENCPDPNILLKI